jgi:hypothetical protein
MAVVAAALARPGAVASPQLEGSRTTSWSSLPGGPLLVI